MNVDLFMIVGYKIYLFKGVGVFYICKGMKVGWLFYGVEYECGVCFGIENVFYIVVLGKFCELI